MNVEYYCYYYYYSYYYYYIVHKNVSTKIVFFNNFRIAYPLIPQLIQNNRV